MTNLVVDVYSGEVLQTTVRIPLRVLQLAGKLVPRKAAAAIEEKGLNLQEILDVARSGSVSGPLLEVSDHPRRERIVVSVL